MFHKRILILAVVTVSFWLSNQFAGAITTAPSWKPRETVADSLTDWHSHQGSTRTLAYDHHGNPGIAFNDAVDDDLRYARRVPGVGWVHTVVDAAGVVGKFPSLAFDRYERPAITYGDDSNGALKYAHFDGSTWIVETVDIIGPVGSYSSLAFDLLGRPAVAYRDITTTSLKFVADTDGDFSLADETPVTVVNDFNEGIFSSLVFDPLNRPMIAHYAEVPTGDVRFSVEEPAIGWVTTTVNDTSDLAQTPSIAIDPDTGYPAIAYTVGNDLHYGAWDGNAWGLTTVDAGGFSEPSLAFDPSDGNPAISYWAGGNSDLKLAWHDGVAWQTQTVDAVDNVGRTSSIAFNDFGTGFPSIAYLNTGTAGAGSLFFIEDPPAVVPEPASLAVVAFGLVSVFIRRRTVKR